MCLGLPHVNRYREALLERPTLQLAVVDVQLDIVKAAQCRLKQWRIISWVQEALDGDEYVPMGLVVVPLLVLSIVAIPAVAWIMLSHL